MSTLDDVIARARRCADKAYREPLGYAAESRAALLALANYCEDYAAALEVILETEHGKFDSRGDYAAFIRDIARNARYGISRPIYPHLEPVWGENNQ